MGTKDWLYLQGTRSFEPNYDLHTPRDTEMFSQYTAFSLWGHLRLAKTKEGWYKSKHLELLINRANIIAAT